MPIHPDSDSWWNVVIVGLLYALPIATVLWVTLSLVRRSKLSVENTAQLAAADAPIVRRTPVVRTPTDALRAYLDAHGRRPLLDCWTETRFRS